jgi:hypothetical protein
VYTILLALSFEKFRTNSKSVPSLAFLVCAIVHAGEVLIKADDGAASEQHINSGKLWENKSRSLSFLAFPQR